MRDLPVLKPKDVVRALERAGFFLARQRGSHAQYKKGNLLVTVPMHPRDVKPTTLRSILRQAKLNSEEFRALL